MKKWDDLVEETMTSEAIVRSDSRAEIMIAQIRSKASAKEEARRKNDRDASHDGSVVPLQFP